MDLTNPEFAQYRTWKRPALENACRVIHILSLFMAGLCQPRQNLLWFTDEDAIAANPQRLYQLTDLFAWISSGYLSFDMGHLRCGTTASDDGSKRIEDLAAIPDLIAGAVSEQLEVTDREMPDMVGNVFWLHAPLVRAKTNFISRWLIKTEAPLKRLVFYISSSESAPFCSALMHFDARQST